MTPDIEKWQSSITYDYMDEVDVDALAWECLRRNREYQSDFAKITKAGSNIDKDTEAIGNRWGLRFPCPTKPQRTGTSSFLDA